MRLARLPPTTSALWPAAILVATALVVVPMPFLPSFDVPKLAFLLLSAAVLATLVARRRDRAERDGVLADPILALPLLLTLVAAVGGLVAWPGGSLVGPATALACLALARIVAQSEDPRRAATSLARGVAVAAVVAGVYGLCQWQGRDFTPWAARREPVATFGNTSFAAEFHAAALPFALLLALRRDAPRIDRALGGGAALLSAAQLALGIAIERLHLPLPSFPISRTDVVAAVAGLGVGACLLLVGRGRRRAAVALAGGGVLATALFVAAFFAAPSWLGRSDTIAVRRDVWRSTATMIADEPLHVAGRTFVDRYPQWRAPQEYRVSMGRRVETPHDDWLEIATALGVPGVLAALGVAGLLAARLVAAAPGDAGLVAALGASLAATATSALASSPLSHPATALLPALAAGVVVGLAPRPLRGVALPARAADVVFAVALATAFWPGPALRNFRSDGFLALGREHLDRGDAALALSVLDNAAGVDPQAFDARFELGSLLARARRPEEAIAALRSAQALRPGDFDCATSLAYALRDAGRKDEAKRLIDASLARCPWHPLLLAARAIFALEDGRAADAVPDAERAAALLPHDARIAALAAEARLAAVPSETAYGGALDALVALFDDGQTEELGRCARSMLRRERGLLGPLVSRAKRLADSSPDKATALVLAAQSVVTDDAGFFDDAAQILRRAGHPDESKIFVGRALGVRAGQALAAGQNEKALKLAEQAAARDPSSAHYLLVARAATRLGERDAAVESVGAAVAVGSVDPDAIRLDPVLSTLLPNRRLEDVLESAARRNGEKQSAGAIR